MTGKEFRCMMTLLGFDSCPQLAKVTGFTSRRIENFCRASVVPEYARLMIEGIHANQKGYKAPQITYTGKGY